VQRRKELLTSCDYLRGRGLESVSDYEKTSFWSLAKRIYKNEGGILAFYRGYTAYMFAILFWLAALPGTSELI